MTFKQRAEEICRKVMGFPDVTNDVLSLRGEIETALRSSFEEGKIEGKKMAEYVAKYQESDDHVEKCCRESYLEGLEDAAKVADEWCIGNDTDWVVKDEIDCVASHIRQLKSGQIA